jgi:hypothetical protein
MHARFGEAARNAYRLRMNYRGARPATAQAPVDNPGLCVQFDPDANCENHGPGNPYNGAYSTRDLPGANVFMAVTAAYPSLNKCHVHRAIYGLVTDASVLASTSV